MLTFSAGHDVPGTAQYTSRIVDICKNPYFCEKHGLSRDRRLHTVVEIILALQYDEGRLNTIKHYFEKRIRHYGERSITGKYSER